MSSLIHKPGQGYWTRVLSAAGAALLILYGGRWLFVDQLQAMDDKLIKFGISLAAVLVCFGISFVIFNKPKIVDFFIATDSEMKKVNWPEFKDVCKSTFIVIAGTFLLSIILFLIDLGFTAFFIEIGVLDK